MRYFLLFSILVSDVFANPTNGEVISGEALISSINPQTMHVHASDKAIIHWDDFSIGIGEMTKFLQPHVDAAVLNRVVGHNLSSILGQLEANGHVLLINQNGIIFGKDASINTGSFTATTLDLLDEDFIKGKELIFQGRSEQSIVNYGKIEAKDGDVILASFQIDNQGEILAPSGTCSLGASQEVILMPEEDEKLLIRSQIISSEYETGLNNNGVIEGLKVELKANGTPYEYAVQHSGIIREKGFLEKDGKVLLVAEEGTAFVNGEISCHSENDVGGNIHILGEKSHSMMKLSSMLPENSEEGKSW